MISIIIPVYNAQRYIRECLESIKNQTYKDLEVVIVNDGSNDNSEQIIQQYSGCFNLIYLRQENQGVSVARNKGLELSSGEWVLFLDADDYLDSDALKLMVESAMEECVVLGKVMSATTVNSGQGKVKTSVCQIASNEVLNHGELYTVWNKLYPRRMIADSKIEFTTGLCYGEDILFNLKVFSSNGETKFCYLDKETYFYRMEENHVLKKKFVDQYAMLINDFVSFSYQRHQNNDVIIARLFVMVINIICMEGVKNGWKKKYITENIRLLLKKTNADNLDILKKLEYSGTMKCRIQSRLLRKSHFNFYIIIHQCVNYIEKILENRK